LNTRAEALPTLEEKKEKQKNQKGRYENVLLISALRRGKRIVKFQANLGYRMRPFLKKTGKNYNNRNSVVMYS
jgi:hypothetical protein